MWPNWEIFAIKKKKEEKVMKLTMRPFKFDEANNGQHNRNETF